MCSYVLPACVAGATKATREYHDPIELELQPCVNLHVGEGNGMQVLWKEQPVPLSIKSSV